MPWPSSDVPTTAMDAGTDTPPRSVFLAWAQAFNLMRNHVTTFMQGLLTSNSAADARATLDVPSRAGGNATGTWGIAISGNASTATTATNCSRSVTGAGLASGGGALTADRAITVTKATQVQAEDGTDDATAMTPLRTAQAIAALAPDVVAATQAGLAVGAVGTYAFCQGTSGVTAATGAVVAGSSLRFADRAGGTSSVSFPTGSWRCMGVMTVSDRATVFLRIS